MEGMKAEALPTDLPPRPAASRLGCTERDWRCRIISHNFAGRGEASVFVVRRVVFPLPPASPHACDFVEWGREGQERNGDGEL